MSSTVNPEVDSPSMRTMTSPLCRPASQAGDPSIGAMTVGRLSRMLTTMPMPSKLPWVTFSRLA